LSKYSIYRIDNPDPAGVGRRRRRLSYLFVVLAFSIVLLFMAGPVVFKTGFMTMYPIAVLLTLGLSVIYHLRMKYENSKLKVIGDIEFTRTEIVKHIGDSVEEFSYNSVQRIELEKHIPAINVTESKSGYLTYILSLNLIDAGRECFVFSDKPIGKRQNLCISDTLKYLRNLTSTEIIIMK